VVGRHSSDPGKLQVASRILITSHGDRTVPASSSRQLLRDQEFAMDTRSSMAQQRWVAEGFSARSSAAEIETAVAITH